MLICQDDVRETATTEGEAFGTEMDHHVPNNPDAGFEGRADGKQAQEQDVDGEEDGGERGKDRVVTKTSIVAKKLIV